MVQRWLNWMNDGELIPLTIAVPLLIGAFFVPMMLLAGLSAPWVWLQGLLGALVGL